MFQIRLILLIAVVLLSFMSPFRFGAIIAGESFILFVVGGRWKIS